MAKQATKTGAATDKKTAAGGKQTATVISEFRDIDDFDKVHEVGDDVSHFSKERLQSLSEKGHVELSNDPTADDADADKLAEARKAKLDEVLKDSSDAFKGLVLSNYEHMTFKNDAAYTAFLEKVKADSASFGQAGTNEGNGAQ